MNRVELNFGVIKLKYKKFEKTEVNKIIIVYELKTLQTFEVLFYIEKHYALILCEILERSLVPASKNREKQWLVEGNNNVYNATHRFTDSVGRT